MPSWSCAGGRRGTLAWLAACRQRWAHRCRPVRLRVGCGDWQARDVPRVFGAWAGGAVEGARGPPYPSSAFFWIVRRPAIDFLVAAERGLLLAPLPAVAANALVFFINEAVASPDGALAVLFPRRRPAVTPHTLMSSPTWALASVTWVSGPALEREEQQVGALELAQRGGACWHVGVLGGGVVDERASASCSILGGEASGV